MSFFHSPRIVTDGLRLYVDFGNKKSYSGDGTNGDVVTELIGGNLGTFSTGSYESTNLGRVKFNTDALEGGVIFDSGSFTNSLTLPKTINFWLNPASPDDQNVQTIFSWVSGSQNDSSAYANGGYGIFHDRAGLGDAVALYVYPTPTAHVRVWKQSFLTPFGTWQNVCVTLDEVTPLTTFYQNGGLFGTTGVSLSTQWPASKSDMERPRIGNIGGAIRRRLNGWLAMYMEYDRILTEQEVLQNFNALRGRFGI